MSDNKLGFIGVGQLGRPMVKHLLDNGYEVRVHNRHRGPLEDLIAKGAIYCDKPEDVITRDSIIFNCLPDDNAVLAIFEPRSSIFDKMGSQGLHVSLATISPETSKILDDRHQQLGGNYCVATVMGRPDAVENKKHFYILAGKTEFQKRAEPLLKVMGNAVYSMGEIPQLANAAKLGFNFMIASMIETMGEAFTFVKKNNVDLNQFFAMLTETHFACPAYKNYGASILNRAFQEPLFRLALGAKDMNLVNVAAKSSKSPMRFASVLQDRFTSALAKGHEDFDWIGIVLDIEDEAGLK
jgi:3-hydroxyisobutyrate dehydrogenase-like beta-hydroxyacid dehydrogenase